MPTYSEALKLARSWPPEFLACRALGQHAWTSHRTYQEGRARTVEWDCARGCGCVRWWTMTASGHVTAGGILYPDGYLSGIGRLSGDSRDAVRRVLVDQNGSAKPTIARRSGQRRRTLSTR